jgi:hypothetical protein
LARFLSFGDTLLDIRAHLGTFDDNIPPQAMVSLITAWCNALVATNLVYLQMYPNTVALYDSGVYYKEEKFGEEDFFDIPAVLNQGFADCEDLASWRVAEYLSVGVPASILVTYEVYRNGDILFHVRVRSQFGIEDPSEILGMYRRTG